MLPGKYVEVVMDFSDPLELTGRVKEGYLKVAWRNAPSIKTGYILIKNGKVVGSIVENILENIIVQGELAFFEILEATKHKLVKTVELYEADVNDILREYPGAYIAINNANMVSGNDLGSFLSILKTYKGEVKIQDGSKIWVIYVENGLVKAAKAIMGSTNRGDSAIEEILKEMGNILRDGRYIMGGSLSFSSHDTVKNRELLLKSLELLKEKQEFEKDF